MSRTTPFGRAGKLRDGRTQSRPRRARLPIIEMLAALLAVGALAYVAIDQGLVADIDLVPERAVAGAPVQMVSRPFTLCSGAGGTCVIDGDTIRIDGQSIRIADIDTPEVRGYGCPEELALGQAATLRMLSLVNAGPFELGAYPRDEDVYGRKLRILKRDGQSLGMILVAEGLAREWDGARRDWC